MAEKNKIAQAQGIAQRIDLRKESGQLPVLFWIVRPIGVACVELILQNDRAFVGERQKWDHAVINQQVAV